MIGFLKKSICDFLNFSLLVFDDDEDDDDDDENPAPPYMPIQGQRRTASLEKKRKPNKLTKEKQNKASCKQQWNLIGFESNSYQILRFISITFLIIRS